MPDRAFEAIYLHGKQYMPDHNHSKAEERASIKHCIIGGLSGCSARSSPRFISFVTRKGMITNTNEVSCK